MAKISPRFEIEPFHPAQHFQNRHVQTIASNFLRTGHAITRRRLRLETPDDDFLDLDYYDVAGHSWALLGDKAPVVLLIHGLEGCTERGYMMEQALQLAQRGMRPIGLNLRSCSGELNRQARFYHAGEVTDVSFVLNTFTSLFPKTKLGVVGFSLGGSMLLNYLGTPTSTIPSELVAVAVNSPPMNMYASLETFNHGSGRLYANRHLGSLKRKVVGKAHLLQDKIDLYKTLAATTVYDFDHYCTAQLHGYGSAERYYKQTSPHQRLHAITTPTLIIRSQDDPLFADRMPPLDNQSLTIAAPAHGGHVGFMEGVPGRHTFWAERQAARYLQAQFLTTDRLG